MAVVHPAVSAFIKDLVQYSADVAMVNADRALVNGDLHLSSDMTD